MRNLFSLKEFMYTYVFMNIVLRNFRFIVLLVLVLACNNSFSLTITKPFYYSDASQSLDLTLPTPKIDFDGIDDHIDFGDVHDLTSHFSLEAWVLQEAATATGTIISKGDTKAGNKRGYQLTLINNYPNITWYNSTGTAIVNLTSPYHLVNNKWYHIATTYDGVTVKLFIDGLKVNEVSTTTAPLNGTEKFIIGAIYDSGTPNLPKKYFDGFIDEVRIWNVALSEQQIREMMNQEIEQNEAVVKGTVIPLAISGGLLWANLKGYYPMNDNTAQDKSGNNINGITKNINTIQIQSAPLPYTTKANGEWTDNSISTPWTNGNSVWHIPNSIAIDGTTPIDWNIVKTSHNITSGDKNIIVLGLITNTPATKLTIADPTDPQNETNSGQSLRVTHYLKLIGDIDLVGESQLLQDQGSILDVTSSGKLDRDQQGSKDLYTYKYWSSPVGLSNTTSNNNSYKLTDNVLRNGTVSTTPNNITFLTSGYNGSVSGTNISIADYWIWKYANNTSNSYSAWQHVRRTGTILAGEGFTMKGVENSGTSFTSTQNYNFYGKPNNGDITLTVASGNDYLVGNPYPSTLDADEFILDNTSSSGGRATTDIINGTLYFWDHFANSTHALKAYEGGYATYSRMGALPAISTDIGINSSAAIGSKTPRRYIPVSQGFFVVANTGGTITFKNSQRVFKTKSADPSIFSKATNSNATLSKTDEDIRQKIRLKFDSPNGYHRLLLTGIDVNTSNAFDIGYDAPLIENNAEDMFWVSSENNKYIIQAVNNFDANQILPLGVKINKAGLATIKIDLLENIDDSKTIFIHDKELNIYTNLKNGNYQVYLNTGSYLERFEIKFSNASNVALDVEDIADKSLHVYFSNEKESIVIHNPDVKNIESTEIFNIVGQSIYKFNSSSKENYMEYKTKHLNPGTYIIKLKTDSRMVSKKVLIK